MLRIDSGYADEDRKSKRQHGDRGINKPGTAKVPIPSKSQAQRVFRYPL
jgi:hypothetical protein